MPCPRRTIAASGIDYHGAAAQVHRQFTAQDIGPEPIHFAVRQCPPGGDTERHASLARFRQRANGYTIPLNVDACLTQQVREDKIRPPVGGNATALDRLNLTALGQARFHDERPRRALRYCRHELHATPGGKDHQRSVSGTGRKLNSSVAQSFHISQRTDSHELDVLPFLLKDAQLLGYYQGHEGTRHKIRNGDTHVMFPWITFFSFLSGSGISPARWGEARTRSAGHGG